MKTGLEIQKSNLQLAVALLNEIEIYDGYIKNNHRVEWAEYKKKKAIIDYADIMTIIVEDAIKVSGIKIVSLN